MRWRRCDTKYFSSKINYKILHFLVRRASAVDRISQQRHSHLSIIHPDWSRFKVIVCLPFTPGAPDASSFSDGARETERERMKWRLRVGLISVVRRWGQSVCLGRGRRMNGHWYWSSKQAEDTCMVQRQTRFMRSHYYSRTKSCLIQLAPIFHPILGPATT